MSTRSEVNVVHRVSRLIVDRHHHVGDVAVDHVVCVEHHRADRSAFGEPAESVGVDVVGCQQRELCERGTEQRSRHQPAREFGENRCSIG